MTSTLDELEAQKLLRREERRARERANRIGTNIKPHLREILEEQAAAAHVSPRTMLRVLMCEGMEGRGINLTERLADWRRRNPNAVEDDDE